MLDIPASVVVTALTTLVSGAMGAILTNVLNARRSTDEKIWELRRTAYGNILAELSAVERILRSADEYIQENEMGYFEGKVSRAHDESIAQHMELVRKSYTDNYLILSNRFIRLFEEFLRSLDHGNPYLNPPEEHDIFAAAVRGTRPKLLQQARNEMPLRGGLRDRLRRRAQ
jgi:hypothetical protein